MTKNRVELKDFTGLRSIYLNFIVFFIKQWQVMWEYRQTFYFKNASGIVFNHLHKILKNKWQY